MHLAHLAGSEEVRRPMALLAIAAYRAQRHHGNRNGAWKVVLDGLPEFLHATNLRFKVPSGAGSDMALCARHPGVRRQLVGDILRRHGMANGAAE